MKKTFIMKKTLIRFIRFQGASKEADEFVDRGPVFINPDRIIVFYDHTIMAEDSIKIRVMETCEEIAALINTGGE